MSFEFYVLTVVPCALLNFYRCRFGKKYFWCFPSTKFTVFHKFSCINGNSAVSVVVIKRTHEFPTER